MNKDLTRLNAIFGFVGYFTGRGIKEKGSAEGSMVFKTKTLNQGKNNKGSYLQNDGKAEILKKYNSIMEVTKSKKYLISEIEDLSKVGFAIVTEMLMRKMNDERQLGMIWYLTPEEAIVNGIEDV